MVNSSDTITAIATGTGGAIAVIRVSGRDAISLCDKIFQPVSGKSLTQSKGYTLHYGTIEDQGRTIDDVVVSLFKAPHSYTGEDMIEISCHASRYIQQEIIQLLIRNGARMAGPGEFTIRAFLAGKLDLSQAEAVADIIASGDRATHALASNQMRGGYSAEFSVLRSQLIELLSLLELELDFGEEDVEFADRNRLSELLENIDDKIERLLRSFTLGNAIKEGVGVAIIGSPNVGKSTLLNTLLKEDRAMVSDIAGTTRDVIEESINLDGIRFRFIDTAGIHATEDTLEKMGIERTFLSTGKARIVLLMVEASDALKMYTNVQETLKQICPIAEQQWCVVVNKADRIEASEQLLSHLEKLLTSAELNLPVIGLSAKTGQGVDALTKYLVECIPTDSLYNGDTVISNSRHYEALHRAQEALRRAADGLRHGLPGDLLAQDIREVSFHIGSITGEVTTQEILSEIFSHHCIGK